MQHQSRINYRFGQKNNWRARCWNQISDRISYKRSATCLYLAAEDDLDRDIAIRKGFRSQNLFAVDRQRQVIKKLRSEKKPAIYGDMFDVLCSFGGADVVFADFCSGFTAENIDLMHAALFGGGVNRGGVLVLNMLRGRESGLASSARKELSDSVLACIDRGIKVEKEPKHRGQLMLLFFLETVIGMFRDDGWPEPDLKSLFYDLQRKMRPELYSYKCEDGIRVMDSLVVSQNIYDGAFLLEKSTPVMRQIAAQKAWATMRSAARQ